MAVTHSVSMASNGVAASWLILAWQMKMPGPVAATHRVQIHNHLCEARVRRTLDCFP